MALSWVWVISGGEGAVATPNVGGVAAWVWLIKGRKFQAVNGPSAVPMALSL